MATEAITRKIRLRPFRNGSILTGYRPPGRYALVGHASACQDQARGVNGIWGCPMNNRSVWTFSSTQRP